MVARRWWLPLALAICAQPAPCGWPCPQPLPGFAPDPDGPISHFSP